MGGDRKFSDEMLFQMKDDLENHIQHCNEQFDKGTAQFEELAVAMKTFTDTQTKLNTELTKLTEATTGVIQLEKDVQSVIRIGKGTQNFFLWLIKWPLIATGLYTAYAWMISHAPFK